MNEEIPRSQLAFDVMDEQKLRKQLDFFDYIYPSMQRNIDTLTSEVKNLNMENLELIDKVERLKLDVRQYKAKIQRIEQFLIKKGLIKLLGEED